MHRVTQDWLKANSRNGVVGWNAKQLAVLGISWPPHKGWAREIEGKSITDQQRFDFEALSGQSKEGIKIDRGRANMATNPIYRTWPDGNGGWFGEWVGDARYPWTDPNALKSVHSPKAKP